MVDRLDGATYANGVASQLSWDLNDRLARITHSPTAGGALFDVEYGYDEDDYRIWSQDHVRSDHSELIAYDELNRVRRVDRGVLNGPRTAITQPLDSPVLPSIENWVRLDRRGNWKRLRTGYGSDPTVREDREVNAVNEYQTIDPDGPAPGGPAPAVPLAADANGNLLENPLADTGGVSGHQYAYDEENRLTTVSELGGGPLLDVFYDAFGTRVESVDHTGSTSDCGGVTTIRHVSFDGATVEEYQACGVGAGLSFTLAREFVGGWSFIDPIAMVDHTGLGDVAAGSAEVLHYVTDALGSVIALTNASSTLVERYDYSTYGKTFVLDAGGVHLDASAFGNPFGWTGQRHDYGVGLYHFLYRSFSTHLARWMQRDLAEFVDGPNLREYVRSTPFYLTDRLGLDGTLTIYVYKKGDVGSYPHASVGVKNNATGSEKIVGKYPKTGDQHIVKEIVKGTVGSVVGMEGTIVDDSGKAPHASKKMEFPLTDEGVDAAEAKIEELEELDEAGELTYQASHLNCAGTVSNVAASGGVLLEPMGLLGIYPGDLKERGPAPHTLDSPKHDQLTAQGIPWS